MNKIILIIVLLFIGCASNSARTCKNHGAIDFIYINVPCEGCIDLVNTIFANNNGIFSYDVTHNKEDNIMVTYCYDYKKINPEEIEKNMVDNNFPVNKKMNAQQEKYLKSICCDK